MFDENKFKAENRGKPLSEIARLHMNELIDADADAIDIKRAMIVIRGAELAERLLISNEEGEANVHFMGSIIAGLMSEISPAHLLLHFADVMKTALFLRRVHDAHFDEKLTELEQTKDIEFDTIYDMMTGKSDGKVH